MVKGENAGYQHFLLSPQRFQKISFPKVLKVGIVWEIAKHLSTVIKTRPRIEKEV